MALLPPFAPPLAQIASDALGLGVGLGIGFLLLLGLLALLGVALFAFWVWMLVDCAQAPEPPGESNHRLAWILILAFTSGIGALLYFVLVRQPRRAALRARGFTSPPMPSSGSAGRYDR